MDFLSYFGEKLRGRILKGGYETVELFAHEHGIAKSTLSELLSGKTDPRLTTLFRICAGLEMSPADFLNDPVIESWVRESAPRYHRPRRGRGQKKGKKAR